MPENIFLTGGTGFLGVFLLYELLEQTNANIYCLVRASTKIDGKQRLQQSLKINRLWKDNYENRIIPSIKNFFFINLNFFFL